MKFTIKARNTLFNIALMLVLFMFIVNQVQAQANCPSGIVIDVSSGNDMIAIWSPLSNGDYRVTRGNNAAPTHTGKDVYALDLSIPGSADRGKAVYLPITGRIWSVRNTSGYGNTTFIWDPGTGILIRLAHLLDFSSVLNGANGNWFGAGTKAGYIGETGCPGCGEHLHLVAYRNVRVGLALSYIKGDSVKSNFEFAAIIEKISNVCEEFTNKFGYAFANTHWNMPLSESRNWHFLNLKLRAIEYNES